MPSSSFFTPEFALTVCEVVMGVQFLMMAALGGLLYLDKRKGAIDPSLIPTVHDSVTPQELAAEWRERLKATSQNYAPWDVEEAVKDPYLAILKGKKRD